MYVQVLNCTTHDHKKNANKPARPPPLTKAIENSSWVLPGPGRDPLRANKSANVTGSSHGCLEVTKSLCKRTTWTWGPPKLTKPNGPILRIISARRAERDRGGGQMIATDIYFTYDNYRWDLLSHDGYASCINGFVSSISQDSSSLFGSFFVQVFIVQYIGSLATVVEDMLQPKTLPPTTVIHELDSKIQ